MDDSRKIVLKETGIVAVGVLICSALMVGIFALLQRFSLDVLLGALVGSAVSIGNFFFMALVATLASDRAMAQDVEGGKKLVQSSQIGRLLAVGAILALCAISNVFDILALLLPMVFVRPVLLVAEFFRKKGA